MTRNGGAAAVLVLWFGLAGGLRATGSSDAETAAPDAPMEDAVRAQEAVRAIEEGRAGAAMLPAAGEREAGDGVGRRFARAAALAGEGRDAEAEAAYRALTAEFPELPEPHNNLAVLLARRGALDAARIELEAAIAVAPGYAVALENLGDVYARLALAAYRRAAAEHPRPALQAKLRQAEALSARAGETATSATRGGSP